MGLISYSPIWYCCPWPIGLISFEFYPSLSLSLARSLARSVSICLNLQVLRFPRSSPPRLGFARRNLRVASDDDDDDVSGINQLSIQPNRRPARKKMRSHRPEEKDSYPTDIIGYISYTPPPRVSLSSLSPSLPLPEGPPAGGERFYLLCSPRDR